MVKPPFQNTLYLIYKTSTKILINNVTFTTLFIINTIHKNCYWPVTFYTPNFATIDSFFICALRTSAAVGWILNYLCIYRNFTPFIFYFSTFLFAKLLVISFLKCGLATYELHLLRFSRQFLYLIFLSFYLFYVFRVF